MRSVCTFLFSAVICLLVSAVIGTVVLDPGSLGVNYIPTQQDYEDLMLAELYERLEDETENIELNNKPAGKQGLDLFNIDDLYSSQTKEQIIHHESLPFYCPPPNPCPKGMTAADGCLEDVADNEDEQKSWINSLMAEGYCDCDQEHMFSCMKKSSGSEDGGMGAMFSNVIMDPEQMREFNKLDKLPVVAKKSPRIKRSIRYNEKRSQLKRNNPFLQGPSLGVVAKKGVIFH